MVFRVADGLVSEFDAMASESPASIAVVADGRATSWEALADRARRVAWHFTTELGLAAGDRIAIALGSDRELLEVLYATLMVDCVPVVLSAGLDADATHAVVDRSDAKVVVHRPERGKVVRTAVKRIPKRWRPRLREIGEEYERLIEGAPPDHEWRPLRAPGDGVLLFSAGASDPGALLAWDDVELTAALRASIERNLRGARVLVLTPLPSTPGCFAALRTLLAGGTVVLVDVEPLDADLVLQVLARDEVEVLSIGSGAILRELMTGMSDRAPHRTLPQLRAIVSSAPIHSGDRRAVSALLPEVELREPRDAPRRIGHRLRVIEPTTGRDVVPGSGQVGTIVTGGAVPLGYFGDPQRTAANFCSIAGVRYAVTRERATVDDTGVIHPADGVAPYDEQDGRAPANDVEEKLRKHPSVAACVVVDVAAMDRVGRTVVVALVQVTGGHYLDEAELAAWCRSRLGRLEPPDRFLFVDRLVGEEEDRERARQRAAELLRA
jgi:fatty-acyl-CoA synthase